MYVDTEGEIHLFDIEQCFEHAKRNATRDAMRAAETRRCLGNLKIDLNDCLDPAVRRSSHAEEQSDSRTCDRPPPGWGGPDLIFNE